MAGKKRLANQQKKPKGAKTVKKQKSVPNTEVIEKPDDFYGFLEFYHLLLIRENTEEKYLKRPGDLLFCSSQSPDSEMAMFVNCGPIPEELGCLTFSFDDVTGRIKMSKAFAAALPSELVSSVRTVDDCIKLVTGNLTPRPIINGLYKLPSLSWTTVKETGSSGFAQISLVKFETGKLPWSHKYGFMKKIDVKAPKFEHVSMVEEALMLLRLRHCEYFVRVIGVSYESGTAMFTEACMTSLYCFLTANRGKIGQVIKLKWSKQAAEALVFLKTHKVVHRALQSKCCFLTNELNLKIGGFDNVGHGCWEDGCYNQGWRCPCVGRDYKFLPSLLRWMPPETIRWHIYGLRSEVWSYGILVWEIYMDAEKPYPGMTDYWVQKKLKTCHDHLSLNKMGFTLPKDCPKPVHSLIGSCMRFCIMRRPKIERVASRLNAFYKKWAVPDNMKPRLPQLPE